MSNQEKIAAENRMKFLISKLKTEEIQQQAITFYSKTDEESDKLLPFLLNELDKRMEKDAFIAFCKRLDEIE